MRPISWQELRFPSDRNGDFLTSDRCGKLRRNTHYDKGFWELAEVRAAEYKKWKERSEAIMDGNHGLDSLFSFTRTQRTLPPLPRGFVSESCEQEDA